MELSRANDVAGGATGFASYAWTDGARYEGDFVDGMKHGVCTARTRWTQLTLLCFLQGEGCTSGLQALRITATCVAERPVRPSDSVSVGVKRNARPRGFYSN